MLHRIVQVLALAVLLIAGSPLRAELVKDLYSAQVRVESQGQAALNSGARRALKQVLVKASGGHDLLRHPAVVEVLDDARRHVQQYAYIRRKSGEGGETELWARFEFASTFVTGVIRDVGAPLWTANRPTVLVWLVVDDHLEGRYFVDRDATPEMSQRLQMAFSSRGVPAKLPLFDLTDTAALGLDEAWQMDAVAILNASSRYDLGNVVIARVALLSEGEIVGDWSYLRAGQRIERSITADSLEIFLLQGVSVVADDMAARFAVAPTAANAEGVVVAVSGIADYGDYADVVNWLQSLELVDRAQVERLEEDVMMLRLEAQADPAQLSTLIELDRRLLPVPSTEAGVQLRYQWQN